MEEIIKKYIKVVIAQEQLYMTMLILLSELEQDNKELRRQIRVMQENED